MSVRVTKKYDPPLAETVTAWKWFVLMSDGTLSYMQFKVPSEGPDVRLAEPMTDPHGFCVFLEKAVADRWGKYLSKTYDAGFMLIPVLATGRICDGKMDRLKVAKYETIMVMAPESALQSTEAVAAIESASHEVTKRKESAG